MVKITVINGWLINPDHHINLKETQKIHWRNKNKKQLYF